PGSLREVARAQPDRIATQVRHDSDVGGADLFRAEIGTANRVQRRSGLVESGRVERGANGSPQSERTEKTHVAANSVGGKTVVIRVIVDASTQRIGEPLHRRP